MEKKVELLAPAGNYEGFIGAVNAGADAVYLGGDKFGARAYADNFTTEEICSAIRYAHLFGRKVYLTVNTLVKESEFDQIYDYILPFYEEGLDGVIVQDIGVFEFIKRNFPKLELHVSTQMAITGPYGAALLKEMGASRIVPARELSLEEIKEIKSETEIEIESFIHGAMCYCYSGNCLFSSILGGRSGNRGRCAQPCRLPYEVIDTANKSKERKDREQYPLSLKDMCTLENIPELIEAGIDSFKIEGRMKKPEYTAGVTALYRKYIDRYYADTQKPFFIQKEDLQRLQSLYIRSEMQDGYYHKHNGKEMITLEKPSYSGIQEEVLQEIRETYLESRLHRNVRGEVILEVLKPIHLMLYEESGHRVEVYGEAVQAALKKPLEKEQIQKQLLKTGASNFEFTDLTVTMETDCFLPVKALNELRREALVKLETELLLDYNKSSFDREEVRPKSGEFCSQENAEEKVEGKKENQLHVSVLSKEQFTQVNECMDVERIYLDYRCEVSFELFHKEKEYFIALPYVLRARNDKDLKQLEESIKDSRVSGVLIRNLEEMGWLGKIGYQKEMVLDANLYCFNSETKRYWKKNHFLLTAPYELNDRELRHLGLEEMSIVVYGNIPMMISANCVRKTTGSCTGGKQGEGFVELKDRYRKIFPVYTDCHSCYNVIYNSVPLSLHQSIEGLQRNEKVNVRLDFTNETSSQAKEILNYFADIVKEGYADRSCPIAEFTKGHFKRGVE